jgi:hypothetical protein
MVRTAVVCWKIQPPGYGGAWLFGADSVEDCKSLVNEIREICLLGTRSAKELHQLCATTYQRSLT